MCGYVSSAFDGSACRYDLINRVLDQDDVNGIVSLYGAAAAADIPLPLWSVAALAALLITVATRRRRVQRLAPIA
jgi:hypothetical protein